MPFAIIEISVANLDLNSTNTIEAVATRPKSSDFEAPLSKPLQTLGRILQTLLSQTLEQPKIDCENSEVQRCKPKKILNKITISFFKPFQHCTFAPSKFSQSTLVVLGLLIVKIHTICPPPCPLKTMRVSRYTLAQLCDWKANIVWWGCGGGSTSRSSTSSDQ